MCQNQAGALRDRMLQAQDPEGDDGMERALHVRHAVPETFQQEHIAGGGEKDRPDGENTRVHGTRPGI